MRAILLAMCQADAVRYCGLAADAAGERPIADIRTRDHYTELAATASGAGWTLGNASLSDADVAALLMHRAGWHYYAPCRDYLRAMADALR